MGRRQDTQPTEQRLGPAIAWGPVVGAIQAASPLGGPVARPGDLYDLEVPIQFTSAPVKLLLWAGLCLGHLPDLEHGERLILVLVQEAIDRTSLLADAGEVRGVRLQELGHGLNVRRRAPQRHFAAEPQRPDPRRNSSASSSVSTSTMESSPHSWN